MLPVAFEHAGVFSLAAMRRGSPRYLPNVFAPWGTTRFTSFTSGNVSPDRSYVYPGHDVCSLPFRDCQKAYQGLSATELLKRVAVFAMLRVPGVSQNAQLLMDKSIAILGRRATYAAIRHTVFNQFCGGETLDTLVTRGQALSQMDIGSIVDYAAESETTLESPVENLNIILHSIGCAARVANESRTRGATMRPAFTAVKVTSLAAPDTLRRLTVVLNMLHGIFFAAANVGPNTPLTRDMVLDTIRDHLHVPHNHSRVCNVKVPRARLVEVAELLWERPVASQIISIWMPEQASSAELYQCTSEKVLIPFLRTAPAPRFFAQRATEDHFNTVLTSWLDAQLVRDLEKGIEYINVVCKEATTHGVRLLMDAEQTFFQTAIDWFVRNAMSTHNRQGQAVVYNTHQMYLRTGLERLKCDLEHAARSGFTFSTKVVRGAYMVQEAAVALERNYPNPVHQSIEATHAAYDEAVRFLLRDVHESAAAATSRSCGAPQILFGTHNERSINKAVDLLKKQHASLQTKQEERTGVCFGQLLGMSDHISRVLASEGFATYKYVPFGELEVVIPYLLRRAQENAGFFSSSATEIKLMIRELKRRTGSCFALGSPAPRAANAHAP